MANTEAWLVGEIRSEVGAPDRRSRAESLLASRSQVAPTSQLVPRHVEWPVRIGIASLFLVNSIIAVTNPQEFLGLVKTNIITGQFPEWMHLVMVRFAAVVDFLIATILVSRRFDRVVFWVMATWMATIAIMKAMNLVF